MSAGAAAPGPQAPPPLVVRVERPDQPEVMALLAALDDYLASLYAPEDNHILSVQDLLAPEVSFYVARLGPHIVGTGAVRRMSGEAANAGSPYGEIKRMYVDPAQRGLGVGAALLSALEAQLRREGLRWALLETGSEQTAAVRLYERQGYQKRPHFGGYPDNGLSVFYGKALS